MNNIYAKAIILAIISMNILNVTYANDNDLKTPISNIRIENNNVFNNLNDFYLKYRNYNISYNEVLFNITDLNLNNKKSINSKIVYNYTEILKWKINNIEHIRNTIFNILYSKIENKVIELLLNLSDKDKKNILNILNQKVYYIQSNNIFTKEILIDNNLNEKEKNIIKYKVLIKILENDLNKKRE